MADIKVTLTIKDTRAGLADYDRMTQRLIGIPETDEVPDFSVEEWRTEWLAYFIRTQMNRFKTSADKDAVTRSTRPDSDVTSV